MATELDMIAAAKTGDVNAVQALLDADPALVNAHAESGESAVLLATHHGNRAVADMLIAHGATLSVFEIERPARKPATMNHVAIAVPDLDAALAFYRDALGLIVQRVDDVPTEKVRVAFLPLGDSEIELMQPTEEGTGITKWMAKHGAGMHHMCIEVADIRASLQRLKAHSAELINPEPVQKPDGTLYAFVHPRSAFGVLVELYQRPWDTE